MTADGLRLVHDPRRQILDPPTPLHRHNDTDAKTVGAVA